MKIGLILNDAEAVLDLLCMLERSREKLEDEALHLLRRDQTIVDGVVKQVYWLDISEYLDEIDAEMDAKLKLYYEVALATKLGDLPLPGRFKKPLAKEAAYYIDCEKAGDWDGWKLGLKMTVKDIGTLRGNLRRLTDIRNFGPKALEALNECTARLGVLLYPWCDYGYGKTGYED